MFNVYSHLIKNNNVTLLAQDLVNRGKTLDFSVEQGLAFLNSTVITEDSKDLDEIVAKIAQTIQSEVKLYKNDFKAQLIAFVDYAKEHFSSIEPSTASKYNIIELDLPDILKDAKDLNLFQEPINFNEIRYIDYQLPYVDLDIITHPEPAINRYIKQLFTTADLEKPMRFFNLANDLLDKSDCLFYVEDLVKAWFIATYLYNNKLDTLSINGQQLQNIIWKLETYIHTAIADYENLLTIERLYLGTREDDPYGIYVLKPVFDSCDNEIGIVDALYGFSIQEQGRMAANTKDSILSNKEELIKIWDTYVAGSKYENPLERRNRLLNVYTVALEKVLQEMPEELLEYCTNKDNIPLLREQVMDKLLSISLTDDIETIESIGIELVAGILFEKTNYYKFIKTCERYLSKDSNTEVDDIIGYVLVELVTDLLMSKMKVFNIV
nr:MAG TPA: hypothetical protein [Caudoviricetes sp.]